MTTVSLSFRIPDRQGGILWAGVRVDYRQLSRDGCAELAVQAKGHAACERHAQATTDNKLQTAFRKLRDSWVRVGNNAEFAEHVDANNQRLKDERERQQ